MTGAPEAGDWSRRAALRIQDEITRVLRSGRRCSVMLTGGESARRLYKAWAELPGFQSATGVDFYFGDERCVAPASPDSNYNLAMTTLFRSRVPAGCSVRRMEAEMPDREAASARYDADLPETVDVLLLGVGEDGHIASLFPNSPALVETHRRVVAVSGPKPPRDRLTITPPVIQGARRIYLLAPGPAKAEVLARALAEPSQTSVMPVRLAVRGDWLVDRPLPAQGVGTS